MSGAEYLKFRNWLNIEKRYQNTFDSTSLKFIINTYACIYLMFTSQAINISAYWYRYVHIKSTCQLGFGYGNAKIRLD